jgi:predicted nucleotide-binding protein
VNEVAATFAKLAGIRKALEAALEAKPGRRRGEELPIQNFSKEDVGAYFDGAAKQLDVLRARLPDLFGDLQHTETEPSVEMMAPHPKRFGRAQLERLARTLDQAFEIRSHSELAAPAAAPGEPRVFISHGRADDWREVQAFIEKDVGIKTLELEQVPNLGRTVLEKLRQEAERCTSAVIVMTGDDVDADGRIRARENVLHEIGYFQGKYGLSAVCLLHEEGTNIPSNIHGLVYIPFPKGTVRATFGALIRELTSFYRP